MSGPGDKEWERRQGVIHGKVAKSEPDGEVGGPTTEPEGEVVGDGPSGESVGGVKHPDDDEGD